MKATRSGRAPADRSTPGRLQMGQERIEERIDAEGVAGAGKRFEVLVVVAFALEGVAEIRVVRHHDEQATGAIGDGADVRFGAGGPAL